jgi:hypothetical protein
MEIWKDIKGYEGMYQVSSLGRVKSLERTTKNQYCKSNYIMKLTIQKSGYKRIGLYKGRKQNYYSIHRLVAEAFIPNPNHLPCVNHKDENQLNNNANNLEWCDYKYNNCYGTRLLRVSNTKKKKVAQYDKNDNLIKIWDSEQDAIKTLGISNHIYDVCNNLRKTCGGFKWKFYYEGRF